MKELTERSFTIYCDVDGKVTDIVHDATNFLSPAIVNNFLFTIVAPSDLDKILNFFVMLRQEKSAVGWEINLNTERGTETFTFFGAFIEDKFGIAAATSKVEANILFENLTLINNEQANLLRSISKENSMLQQKAVERPIDYYEELSQLNNDLVNMQRELAKKNKQLDELNQLKNQFLGMAAHDLRNPLGVIMNFSEFLLTDDQNQWTDDQKNMLNIIQTSSEFMLHLLEDLLDISAIESGNLSLNLEKTDLGTLIRKNIHLNSILADKKQIQIEFEANDEIPLVSIDASKTEQVLNNLISNAIKFSPKKSHITVKIFCENNEVCVSVTDSGAGIPEKEQDKLFKPFAKTSVRPTDGEKSTGLGLSIVRNIIQGHGGKVWVVSELGKGSTFSFSIPV